MNAPLPPESNDSVLEDRLHELLRDSSGPYIDDAGFTARVVGGLPASRGWRVRRRRLLLGAALVLGGGIAVARPELRAGTAAGWALVVEWAARPVPWLGTAFTLGSLSVLLGAVLLAWRAYARER